MYNTSKLFVLIAVLLLTNISHAASDSTLDIFKSLAGSWSIQDKVTGKILPFEMKYELGSRDSIVTEQFGKELSVFHQDKKDLLMTHYCNRGNQPRLKLLTGNDPTKIEFELVDITNLDTPDDPHVQKIVYWVLDSTHLDLEIIWQIGSQVKSEKYSLTKKIK
ncbi:hypothetical protein ACLVWU_10635 [Bdellovibrio sp. HCB290]|uniref:hypothetical protein n=1 Tax=Bdellovibrio sp. HCB290 TaxID=3394356 RepID=UPI0039B4BBCF